LCHAQQVPAQDVYGYSTLSYDSSSNTITSNALTSMDYYTQVYYGMPSLQSKIIDANGNQLAVQSSQTGSLSFSVSGNGSSGYSILSGHWMLPYYREYNVYSVCNNQYYSYAFVDYYNYQNFFSTPSPLNTYPLYDFRGVGPNCPYYSPDIVFGQSTDTIDPQIGSTPITFIDATEVGGSNSVAFTGGIPFASLNISSCGGERFGVKIRFRFNDLGTTITNFNSTVSSTGMFALTNNPVDDCSVCYYGNDNPPYTITYLKKVRSSGNRALTHTLQGTAGSNRAFKTNAVVTLVCQ